MVKRVLFFRPSLGDGGADRVTLTVLENLDRARFAPSLALVHHAGVLADDVPSDVTRHVLGAPRLALAIPALARVLRTTRPDVLVCTAGGANVVAVVAHRLARSRARLVLCERSAVVRVDRSGLRRTAEVALKRALYPRADVVTAVSEGVAADLARVLALDPERIRVVYNPMVGGDVAALADAPVDHPWFAGPVPVLLAVGRLVAIKDYPTLLAAFAALRRQVASSARRARRRAALRASIAGARDTRLGVGDDVALLGYDRNPYRYMRRAAVVVQSSRAEGLPGTLIQSMACGTPVVATDCDHGPREVVRDGVDGYLVPVGRARRSPSARSRSSPTARYASGCLAPASRAPSGSPSRRRCPRTSAH